MTAARKASFTWIVIGVAQCAAIALYVTQPGPAGTATPGSVITFLAAPLLYSTLGVLLIARGGAVGIGSSFLGVGGAFAMGFLLQEVAVRDLLGTPIPGASVAAALLVLVSVGMTVSIAWLVMIFPTGHALSRRWKRIWQFGAMTGALSGIVTVLGNSTQSGLFRSVEFGPSGLGLISDPEGQIAFLLFIPTQLAGLASAVSMLVRTRRARGLERKQLTLAAIVLGFGLSLLVVSGWSPPLPEGLNTVAGAFIILGLPIAAAIAVLRHQLYEMDLVLSKTLVYGSLAAFVTALYIAIVTTVTFAIGSSGEPNTTLSIVASAVVALAFQPARDRLERVANRLVYGERISPYEALAQLSGQMTSGGEDLLDTMAQTLATATGARSVGIWLADLDGSRPLTGHPEKPTTTEPIGDLILPVAHEGEPLGAIAITKAPGDVFNPTEEKLARDLATQAGLVLHNAGLTAQRRANVEQVAASRRRLIEAQDGERKRLERNMHDGAQQEVIAIKIHLGIAAQLSSDPATKTAVLALQEQIDVALESLREIGRGLHPPLLATDGLGPALRAHATKSGMPIHIDADGIGRYEPDIEATAYFCARSAIREAASVRGARAISVALNERDARLHITITDDGSAPSPTTEDALNIADRVAAMDGTLTIDHAANRIEASLPIR